jgi:hypothetical protein
MPVIIGGNSIRPAPQVNFAETVNTLGDGRRMGITTTATLRGTLVADKTGDVETPLTIDQKLASILHKQRDFRALFETDGQWFEVQGYDGSAPVKFIAILDNIEFDQGDWTDKCDYTVTLHGERFADEVPDEDNHVESSNETWQFEEAEGPHTYRATHTLQAKGKTAYQDGAVLPKQAWEYAKDFVTNRLALGWNPTIDTKWADKNGSQMFADSNVQPDAFTPYNRVINETADPLDGTYSVTETFFISQNPWWEEYTVSIRREIQDPWTGNVVTISGTIHGLTPNLHDPEGRFANALDAWKNSVLPILYSRASTQASPVVLNTRRTAEQVDMNPNEGIITYSFEFNDRPIVNDTIEFYDIVLQTGIDDSRTTATINGSIVGIRWPDDPYNPFEPFLKFQRAWNQWQNVKNLMYVRVSTESGVPDLKPFPVSASVTPDKQGGAVNYSFTFDNRIPESVRHEYNVSTRYSREDGRTVITVDGTVTGLRMASATDPFVANDITERYDNARAYFDGMEPNIIGLAASYINISKINPNPYGTTVSHIPMAGQVTYQYEFNSVPNPCVPGALSENVTISDDNAVPVVAEIGILGRAKGPLLQPINTITVRRRTVTIEVVMPVNADMNMCAMSTPPVVDVTGFVPGGDPVYVEQDQTQWTPTNGHFTRVVAWKYEV